MTLRDFIEKTEGRIIFTLGVEVEGVRFYTRTDTNELVNSPMLNHTIINFHSSFDNGLFIVVKP